VLNTAEDQLPGEKEQEAETKGDGKKYAENQSKPKLG
jgi:hypothetical protein